VGRDCGRDFGAGLGAKRFVFRTNNPPFSMRPKRMGHPGLYDWLFAEVGVFFVDPVLAGWGEDVEVDAVFDGGGGVWEVAGDDEDFAGVDGVGGAVVEVEAESAFGDEGDLLVGVGMAGDDAALFENDAGKHGLIAVDELACEERVELLVFDVAPVVESGGGHGCDAFLQRDISGR
jgi:hypothetical protein